MQTQIHYGNLKRSPFLDELVSEQMTRLDRFEMNKAQTDIWLYNQGNLETKGAGLFTVKMRVQRPHRKDYFVKKKAEDFFLAMKKTTKALEHLLRKEK